MQRETKSVDRHGVNEAGKADPKGKYGKKGKKFTTQKDSIKKVSILIQSGSSVYEELNKQKGRRQKATSNHPI